jgi:hypothetical protein
MSAPPIPYTRQANFTNFATEQFPTTGQDLEAEFNKLAQSVGSTQSRLAEIQRDDGLLANLSVHPDSLSHAVRSLLAAEAGVPRGNWAPGVIYQPKDVVAHGGASYLAATEHTAGADFDADLAAGKWLLLSFSNDGGTLRSDLADPTGGASLVAFQQAGSGMVARSMLEKGRDIVHAEDRGLIGDGSDETTALQDLFNASAGKVLMLGTGKTYGIGAAGITIPDNVTLIANGSKFRKLAASANFGITTGENFIADAVILETVGGAFVEDPGVRIAGSNSHVGRVSVTAATPGANNYGVEVGTGVQGSPITNVQIGRIEVSGYRYCIRMFEVEQSRIGFFRSTICSQGIYIRDCKQLTIDGGVMDEMWENSTGSAGQNCVLIESVTADYSCRDIFINNVVSKKSAEHGFRLGGSKKLLNIHHNNCASYLAGSGTASVGGSGFKALGGSAATPHEGIFYTNCYVEDAGSSNSNWSGFILGLVDGAHISNCQVRARTRTHSGFYGIWIDSSRNVIVSDCSVKDSNNYALRISALDAPGFDTSEISVIGGTYSLPAVGFGSPRRCVVFDAGQSNIRNVKLDGVLLRGGEIAISTLPPGSGFSYSNLRARFTFIDPSKTDGSPPIVLSNNADLLVNCDSPFYGTFNAQARDGSLFQDTTNNTLRLRKAGAWTTL